jgi:type II secretory pathway component PulK
VIGAAMSADLVTQIDERALWSSMDRILAESPLLDHDSCEVTLRAAGLTADANHANAEQLNRLFEVLGSTPEAADSLTDAVFDWRDPDDLPREFGAEQAWYELARRLSPRNGSLQSAHELSLIRGLDRFNALSDVLGVEPERICLQHAPATVLASLPGVTEEALVRIIEARRERAGVVSLASIAEQLSPDAQELMLSHFQELLGRTTTEPDAWFLTGRARVGRPPVTAAVEVKLVRAGKRAAIVRRRTWIE